MPYRHSEAVRNEVWRLAMLHWTYVEIGRAVGLAASQVNGIVFRMWKRVNEKG